MSRSGYGCGLDNWDLIRWRGAVASAIRGKRGQAFLREMLEALDALPEPKLITSELEVRPEELGYQLRESGVCAIGAVGKARGVDMGPEVIDATDPEDVASAFGIAHAMAAEIEWVNDDVGAQAETSEERFTRVRAWVVEKIKETS